MDNGALATDKTSPSPAKVLVVGVGNRLLGDEGLGPYLIDVLSETDIPSYVDVIDCGCDLLRLARYTGRPEKIIVVDAIRAGGEPGQIHRLDFANLTADGRNGRSAHQLGAADALRLLRLTCAYLAGAQIILIGVEPAKIRPNTGLSKEVKKSIPELIRVVLEEIPVLSCFGEGGVGAGAGAVCGNGRIDCSAIDVNAPAKQQCHFGKGA